MAVEAQHPEPEENWDDDFDFQGGADEPGTETTTVLSSLILTAVPSQTHTAPKASAHLNPLFSSSALASSITRPFPNERKLSNTVEEDWDVELNAADPSIVVTSNSLTERIRQNINLRNEATPAEEDVENWDDDFEDANSPGKSVASRPPVPIPGQTLALNEENENWDDEDHDTGEKSIFQPSHPQMSSIVPIRTSSLGSGQIHEKENNEFGIFRNNTSDDDEDLTVTARKRRPRRRSPPPPLPQLPTAVHTSMPFPQPSYPSSPSSSRSPALSPPSGSNMTPTYIRSPSAMSGSSAGSSSYIHGAGPYGGSGMSSHLQQNAPNRAFGIGYTSSSVFSLPNTLYSHTSHGSTVPLNSVNATRTAASASATTPNRLKKQNSAGGSSMGFAQLPPSPLIHKERERRRLRKKSRPSVGSRREVYVVDEDATGREGIASDRENETDQHQQVLPRMDAYRHHFENSADIGAGTRNPEMVVQTHSKLSDSEYRISEQNQRAEVLTPEIPQMPQTPRTSRTTTRSASTGVEHTTPGGQTSSHGSAGLLGRIGSVKRWAKAKGSRGSTTPLEIAASDTDRVADGDIYASDFSESYPRRYGELASQARFSEQQEQRTPRPRSSMSSFLNPSHRGLPSLSPSPASPSKWPNFLRSNSGSSPKSKRRMTISAVPSTPSPSPMRNRTTTMTRGSTDRDREHVMNAAPRRSTSQSRSRGAQMYGLALNAARTSNGNLTMNGSRTSLSSVKEHESPLRRERRKSFGRLILDRLPTAMKTPEKRRTKENSGGNHGATRPSGTVRRISLMNNRTTSPNARVAMPPLRDTTSSGPSSPQASSTTSTSRRIPSRSRRYDSDDAPPIPSLSGPYSGILRNANTSQQSFEQRRPQSRASSSASHLPIALATDNSINDNMRVVSSASIQSVASTRRSKETPGRPSLSNSTKPIDFETMLRRSENKPLLAMPKDPSTSSNTLHQGLTPIVGNAPSQTTSLSLLPPIELHPPSPPQTLGASTFTGMKSLVSGALSAPNSTLIASNLGTSRPTYGSDANSATTSTSSLFYTPTSSPNAKKRTTGVLGLSASPQSPGKSASLGRTVGPIVGSESATGAIYSGSGANSKTMTPRRSSLGDLKIPTRISQAQVSIRRDLGFVKEFAGRIGDLKDLKRTYFELLNRLKNKMESGQSSTTSNAMSPSSLMSLFDEKLATTSTSVVERTSLQNHLTSIKARYDISWECAELLIELGGGPPPEVNSPLIPTPEAPRTQDTLRSSIVPKRSRERAITLASTTSGPPPALALGAADASVHIQHSKDNSQTVLPETFPSDGQSSTGRHDLSQRQLLLLREMLHVESAAEVKNSSHSTTVKQSGEEHFQNLPIISASSESSAMRRIPVDGETLRTNKIWRWGAGSSTVELPLPEQARAADSGIFGQSGKTTSHLRQRSRGGFGNPFAGIESEMNAGDNDEEQQKKWKGMRAIRDMLRGMKRVRSEIPQPVPQSMREKLPTPLPASQPIAAGNLSPPLTGNRGGSSSPRFGALGARMGMHSTSSLSSAVSASSHGSKIPPVGLDNSRTTSASGIGNSSSVAALDVSNAPNVPLLLRADNKSPSNFQPNYPKAKAGKNGSRRPSLASIFRIGSQQSGVKADTADNQIGATMTYRKKTQSSPLEGSGNKEENVGQVGSEKEEDDWDCMDSASDIDIAVEHSHGMAAHNATIRGHPQQRQKLSKSRMPNPPYFPQTSYADGSSQGDRFQTDTAYNCQSNGEDLNPLGGERSGFLRARNTADGSQSSLSLSSSHSYNFSSANSNVGPVSRNLEPRTFRLSNVTEHTTGSPDSPIFPAAKQPYKGPNITLLQPLGSQSLSALSTESSLNSAVRPLLATSRSPSAPSTQEFVTTSLSSVVPISYSTDPWVALTMTPENIKPLLENAKEVQERLTECVRELRELLHDMC